MDRISSPLLNFNKQFSGAGMTIGGTVCCNGGPVMAAMHSPGGLYFLPWMVGGGGGGGTECSATDSLGGPILGGVQLMYDRPKFSLYKGERRKKF